MEDPRAQEVILDWSFLLQLMSMIPFSIFSCIGPEVKQKFFHLVYNRGLWRSGAYTVNTISSYALRLVNEEN